MDSITFPEPSLRKRKSIDGSGSSSQVKKRKTKNNSLSLKEEIHSLIEFISNNNTSKSSEPTIEKCMHILENIPGILEGSDIFNCDVNLLTQKEMQHAFLKLSTDEARKSWLELRKSVFLDLSKDLTDKYGLKPTRGMSVYEELGMFLMIYAHGAGNRLVQEIFQHSGETIHRHFHSVLKAIGKLARDIIQPHPSYNDGVGDHKPCNQRYLPFFKDCIGALDGTHVKARLPQGQEIPYIGRKGYPTQNILAVVDFNMCFTFAWVGWEGAAHDNRIFGEALRRPELNFSHPSGDKYYLVDAGYSHIKGYMAPYKGDNSEHLGYGKQGGLFCEICLFYHIDTQRDIVLATMAIHNYIRKKCKVDNAFQEAENERYVPRVDPDIGRSTRVNVADEENVENQGDDNIWMAIRDMIAQDIYDS
nr:uncharacterized protein LOC117275744 [Nicotiana tomentosiformis]